MSTTSDFSHIEAPFCFLCQPRARCEQAGAHVDAMHELVEAFARDVPLRAVAKDVYDYYRIYVRPSLIDEWITVQNASTLDARRLTRWRLRDVVKHIRNHAKPYNYGLVRQRSRVQSIMDIAADQIVDDDGNLVTRNLTAYTKAIEVYLRMNPK